MANQKPMTVLSLECMMGYMEANQRFWLAARCPGLRRIHQSAPLTVRDLKVEETSLVINSYKYEFKVKAEKSKKDFDYSDYLSKLPSPRTPAPQEEGPRRSRRERVVPKRYQEDSFELIKLPRKSSAREHNRTPSLPQVAQLVPQDPTAFGDQSLERSPPSKRMRTDDEEGTSAEIEHQIKPLNRRNRPEDICAIFTLSHVSDETLKYSAKLKNINIEDMMSQVLGKALSQKIIARNLEVVSLATIPVAVKFRIIQNFNTTSHVLEALQLQARILQDGSTFETCTLQLAPGHQHLTESPILHRFKQLNLVMEAGQFEFGRVIQRLPNMKINVSNCNAPVGGIAQIARSWVESNRSLGTKLTVNLDAVLIDSWIEMIMNRLLDMIGFEWKMLGSRKCATLRLGGSNELVICLGNFDGSMMWMLEVMEVGRARAIE
ncbi:unnamed protein product [Caenorhabditis brenneri]